jgi:hypothetical protein
MIQDDDEDAPPRAKEESMAMMAAISHRWQQQDGRICPPEVEEGFRLRRRLRKFQENMVGFLL